MRGSGIAKPCSTVAVVTTATPGSGGAVTASARAATPASASTCTARSTRPWPCAVTTTAHPSSVSDLTWAIAPSALPAKLGTASARTRMYSPASAAASASVRTRSVSPSSRPESNGDTVHQVRWPRVFLSCCTVRKLPASRSIGAWAPGDRCAPGRLQELGVRLGQAVRAAVHPLGREHRDGGVVRQVGGHRHEVLHERRSEGLHALDRDPLGDLREHLGQVRELVQHLACPLPDVVAEQEFARGGELDRAEVVLGRALVGDGERLDRLDLVAEEVDAHRVVGRRREDVEDATAHRELTTAGDEVDAGVGEVDELRRDRRQVVAPRVGPQHHRRQRRQVARDRLQRGADTRHDDGRGDARPASAACHAASFRSVAMRVPTVWALGLRRSCGRVSHAGNSSTSASGT